MAQRVLAEVDSEISKRKRQIQALSKLESFFGSDSEEGVYAEDVYTADQFFDCEISAGEAFQEAREIINEKIGLETKFPLPCLFDALDIYSNLDHCRIIREEGTERDEEGDEKEGELSETPFPPSLDTLDNNGDGIPHEKDELSQFAFEDEEPGEEDGEGEPGDIETDELEDIVSDNDELGDSKDEANLLDKLLENRHVNLEAEETPLDDDMEEVIREKIKKFEENYSDVADQLFSLLREAKDLESAQEEFQNQYKIIQAMANGPINKKNFEKGFETEHGIDLDSDAVSESFRLVDPKKFTVRDYFVPMFIVSLMSLPGALNEEDTKDELLQAFLPGQKISSDSIAERKSDIEEIQSKDKINETRYMQINAEHARFTQIARASAASRTRANDMNEECREDLKELTDEFIALKYVNHGANDANKFYIFILNRIVPQLTKMAFSRKYKKENQEDDEEDRAKKRGYNGYNTEKEGFFKGIKKGIHKKFLGEGKKLLATEAERFKKGAQEAKATNQNSKNGMEGLETPQEVSKKQRRLHDVGIFEYLDQDYNEQLKVTIVKGRIIDDPMINTFMNFLPLLFVDYDVGTPPQIQKHSDKKPSKSKGPKSPKSPKDPPKDPPKRPERPSADGYSTRRCYNS